MTDLTRIIRGFLWSQLFRLTESRNEWAPISEADILDEIQAYRHEKKAAK